MTQDITPVENSFHPSYSAQLPYSAQLQSSEATKQLFFIIFKWMRLTISLFIAFTVAGAVAMYLKPPVRSATADILIKTDRTPLAISGLAAKPDKNQVAQILNSEVELIQSRHVLGAVAMKLLSNPHRDEGVGEDELEAKIESLSDRLVPVARAESSVLQVTYFAGTSEDAEKTLGFIIDEYIEKQAAIQSGSNKLLRFYEQEQQRVETELRQAEDELNEWQGRNGTVAIREQINGQLDTLEDRKRMLQQTDTQLEATKARISMLTNELKAQPERLVMGQEHVTNPLMTRLQEQLATAEASGQDLLQRFTEKHRSVQEKRDQIAFLKKELSAVQESIIGRETTGLNPLRESLKQQLSDSQTLLSSLISQRAILRNQVRDLSDTLSNLREKKVKIDELSRRVDLRKDVFMLYGKKLEESRIATGLGKEQLANLALIGPPHATGETDFTKRIRLVVLSGFVGLTLGLAIAFGLEFFNNALRTRQDVEYYLGLPVLAAVPELPPTPLMLDYDRKVSL
jgi:uncharacterized protein involved in exopolysaccharide biosynthesis